MRKDNSDFSTAFVSEAGSYIDNRDYFAFMETDDMVYLCPRRRSGFGSGAAQRRNGCQNGAGKLHGEAFHVQAALDERSA